MQESDFLQEVRRLADLDSDEAARAATEATLRTLSDRISRGEAEDIARQLPSEIGGYLTETTTDEPEEFGVDDFLRRVGEIEDVDEGRAKHHVRAVHHVLASATNDVELRDARQQLPNEFDSLFEPPQDTTGEAR